MSRRALAVTVAAIMVMSQAALGQDTQVQQSGLRSDPICLSPAGLLAVLGGSPRKERVTARAALYDDGSEPVEFWLSDNGQWALVAVVNPTNYCILHSGIKWEAVQAG